MRPSPLTCTHAGIHTCSPVNTPVCKGEMHSHSRTDSQQAGIVMMMSGSALKTQIGPEYSLSLDGARLNFRASLL